MSVQDVQYCPNRSGRSGFENASVRGIEGIVTADTSDIQNFSYSGAGGTQTSPARVIIQNGQGQYSGIWIFGTPTNTLHRGDRVRVKGTVEENFGVTRINTSSASDVVVLGTNQPLPTAENLSTSVFANNKPDGDPTVEPWESVFIRINTTSSITCINAAQGISCTSQEPLQDTAFRRNFGEILVKDNSNIEARIELQDGNHHYRNGWNPAQVNSPYILLTKYDEETFYQGILFYSFSNWKLVPRRDTDFGVLTPIGIKNLNEVVSSYQLFQNYPNPFNPTTTIKFSIPSNGFVTLQIFDMLGREVKSLVNNQMNAGFYSYDFNASELSSGIYFYRIQVNGDKGVQFVNTKRMVLVK
ncbi:MAG: T9SS type A sorting domain-containing protein [Bacteroidetes bacterium]|nr:T9SS type A sorting domain-containing protein [Bacteroidota bacterium]